eukprot:1159384-Pelagomonas_calceolata.AAC.3
MLTCARRENAYECVFACSFLCVVQPPQLNTPPHLVISVYTPHGALTVTCPVMTVQLLGELLGI